MVRTCKRKTKRQSWKEENMKKAIDAVENEMVVRAAATNFDVPGMALKPRIQKQEVVVLPKQLNSWSYLLCIYRSAS